MKCLNEVRLLGYVGRDPEIKYTSTGKTVARFSLATTERWKDNAGSEKERTDWHQVVAWEHLAELVSKCVGRGDPLLVSGRIRVDKYEKDGENRVAVEVQANDIVLLKAKGGK